jgi:Tfp pilus assembly protein PilO
MGAFLKTLLEEGEHAALDALARTFDAQGVQSSQNTNEFLKSLEDQLISLSDRVTALEKQLPEKPGN